MGSSMKEVLLDRLKLILTKQCTTLASNITSLRQLILYKIIIHTNTVGALEIEVINITL